MIKLLKKIYFKKKLVGAIIIFLSAIFLLPISSVEAKGEEIPPVYEYPLSDNLFFANSFKNNSIKNDYIDLYDELIDYYYDNLADYYDTYVIRANICCFGGPFENLYAEKPLLFYFNSEDVIGDFLFINNNYYVFDFSVSLQFSETLSKINYLSYNDNNEIVHNTDRLSINKIYELYNVYLSKEVSSNIQFFFETNLNKSLVWNKGDYGANTIMFKNEFYNIGDVMYEDLSVTQSQSQSYIFNLDGDVFKNNIYKGLIFYFKRPGDGRLKFKFELIENDEDKPSFDFVPAFDLSFLNLAETLEKIKNCEYNPDGFGGCFTGPGGSFGGGGGGGRFGDEDDYCGIVDFTTLPEIITQMTSEYGMFYMLACEEHKKMKPSDFKTTQIKISTNAQIFLTYKELEEEFLTNPPEWWDWNDSEFDYDDDKLKQPTNLFKIVNQYLVDNREVINEVGKTIDEVFQGLNPEIKNFIIAIYSLLILSAIMVMIRR